MCVSYCKYFKIKKNLYPHTQTRIVLWWYEKCVLNIFFFSHKISINKYNLYIYMLYTTLNVIYNILVIMTEIYENVRIYKYVYVSPI